MNKENRIKILVISIFVAIVAIFAFSGCNVKKKTKWFGDSIKTTELKRISVVNSREDLTNLMDYSAFYSRKVEAQVSKEYKEKLKNDFDNETRWAVQYGDLAHNVKDVLVYDENLDKGIIAVECKIPVKYGYKTGKNNNRNIYTLDYYLIKNKKGKKIGYKDLRLFKNNKGFIRVENSEQLFYAALNGYFPVWDRNNSTLYKIMMRALDILSHEHGKNEFERIRRTYLYMINEATYDLDTQRNKTSDHRDYAAYYLEGFFLHNQAVCDGLTKAYALLLALDGFENYHVADVIKGIGGHAYNYVKVGGEFYLSSITNSIPTNGVDRTRDYRYFLTDYKANGFDGYGFKSEEFPSIKEKLISTKPVDYISRSIVKIGLKEIKLKNEDIREVKRIITYAKKIAKRKGVSIEIQFDTSSRIREEISKTEDVEIICEGCSKWACYV